MLPQDFLDRMKIQLGEEYPAFLESLERPRAVALRFNPLKGAAPALPFVGAIAGGGVANEPHLVSGITVGGRTTYQAEPVSTERILSAETAAIMQSLMKNNVDVKYGAENFPGLTVCAKSGTAEVGPEKKPNAMFTGFVADEKYPLAFIVAVEDGGYGRQICVPIISKVLAQCKAVIDGE